jgi:hypothetical protein
VRNNEPSIGAPWGVQQRPGPTVNNAPADNNAAAEPEFIDVVVGGSQAGSNKKRFKTDSELGIIHAVGKPDWEKTSGLNNGELPFMNIKAQTWHYWHSFSLTDRTSQQLCYNQRRRDRGMFVEDTT